MSNSEIQIRPATVMDVAEVVKLRRLMFEAMGIIDPAQLDASDAACEVYFREAIANGQYCGWLAVTPAGEVVASGGAVVDEHPPGPTNASGRIAYIMNVYTQPAYRRRGLARRIMLEILAWVRATGLSRVALHASEDGRSLYTGLGFQPSNEMRADLDSTF